MSSKQYKNIKLIITFVLAFIFGESIMFENYIIPIISLIISSLILILLRKKVKDIMVDERDRTLGGRSALMAIQIYSWIAVITMFVLYAFRDTNPFYEPIGMTLAYSTCILMIIYSLVFHFYNKDSFAKNKRRYITFLILLFVMIFFFSARLISEEDNWICKDGQWITYGNPNSPAPVTECK